jgi:hypothetical protein
MRKFRRANDNGCRQCVKSGAGSKKEINKRDCRGGIHVPILVRRETPPVTIRLMPRSCYGPVLLPTALMHRSLTLYPRFLAFSKGCKVMRIKKSNIGESNWQFPQFKCRGTSARRWGMKLPIQGPLPPASRVPPNGVFRHVRRIYISF